MHESARPRWALGLSHPYDGDMPRARTYLEKLPQYRIWSTAWASARHIARSKDPTLHWVPPGHFYSPIPSWAERMQAIEQLEGLPERLPGIDLRTDSQMALVEKLASRKADVTLNAVPDSDHRYGYANSNFGHADAAVYAHLLLELRPTRVVEIGSGWSSALLLDLNESNFGGSMEITFVEPYTEVLRSVTRPGDLESRLRETGLQAVPLETFDQLSSGDILFIDSTHVSKAGSDVNYLLFGVLPRLQPGVWVHIHDIFYPFEYPAEWLQEGRAWNENYLVRAFLTYNYTFRIELFVNYLNRVHQTWLAEHMPAFGATGGGSLWLRRTED